MGIGKTAGGSRGSQACIRCRPQREVSGLMFELSSQAVFSQSRTLLVPRSSGTEHRLSFLQAKIPRNELSLFKITGG